MPRRERLHRVSEGDIRIPGRPSVSADLVILKSCAPIDLYLDWISVQHGWLKTPFLHVVHDGPAENRVALDRFKFLNVSLRIDDDVDHDFSRDVLPNGFFGI